MKHILKVTIVAEDGEAPRFHHEAEGVLDVTDEYPTPLPEPFRSQAAWNLRMAFLACVPDIATQITDPSPYEAAASTSESGTKPAPRPVLVDTSQTLPHERSVA